ncbi:MAG TPA: pilus assembly protein PilM [Anaerovoracaceae bacterium]|nr:pilus assembly protein PilM [Anaerovoracaceae bacterium]
MNTLLSIDIGSKNMHIAEGGFQKGQLSLRHSHSFPLPKGCVTEESIKDEQQLADAIISSVKAGKFHTKNVVLTVNAIHTVVRELDFPQAKPKELDSMIKNEMVQTFHIMKDDIIQYKEIGTTLDSDGETLKRYRVAAIDQSIVEAYYNVLDRAKLKAVAMDLNINAIDKLFSWTDSLNERPYGNDAVMLLDFGQSSTTVYIFSKDQPMFYRHLNIGSGEMDSILLDTTQQQIGDAREIKETVNFFDGSEDVSQYYTALQPLFYRLNSEIRKIVTFYHERARSSNIGYTYLFGQGSELLGLPEYWSGNLNLSVEKIRSLGKASKAIKVDPAHFNAIAALIRIEK